MLGAPGGERFNPICRPVETHVKISAVAVVQDWLHPCHPVNYQRFIRILTSDISLKVGIRRASPPACADTQTGPSAVNEPVPWRPLGPRYARNFKSQIYNLKSEIYNPEGNVPAASRGFPNNTRPVI